MRTLADAAGLGILSLELDYSAPATREECAQYGFNAYTLCSVVVWNSMTQAYQQAVNIDGQSARGSLAGQQGVEKSPWYTLNGVTYYKWQKNGVELTAAMPSTRCSAQARTAPRSPSLRTPPARAISQAFQKTRRAQSTQRRNTTASKPPPLSRKPTAPPRPRGRFICILTAIIT